MPKRILILGAGGLAKAIYEAFISLGKGSRVAGFLDDTVQGSFCGLPILGKCSQIHEISKRLKITHGILGFGYRFHAARLKAIAMIRQKPSFQWISAIHASAVVAHDVRIGEGSFIGMGCLINRGTRIGKHVVLWSGTIVEHDNRIGDNAFLTTGVQTAGYVQIGADVFVGMGSILTQCKIGPYATIGAGSLVLSDVPSQTVVWGQPVKFIRKKKRNAYL